MDPFPRPMPDRLVRWPRRTRGRYLSLRLATSSVHQRPGRDEPLATVLNTAYHDPRVLDAIARGEPAPISNQGMYLGNVDRRDLSPEEDADFIRRFGSDVDAQIVQAAPVWLPRSSYLPRTELVALLIPMVRIRRELSFPWLFAAWPCSLVPAPGEDILLRDLEARATRWDDAFLLECDVLGLLRATPATAAVHRAVLAEWRLPRLTALADAIIALQAYLRSPGRWQQFTWNGSDPRPITWNSGPDTHPVSLRYFLDGVAPPAGVAPDVWLAACEVIRLLVVERSAQPGGRGEWIANILGRRVAITWQVELCQPVITGWRPAARREALTPLRTEPDRHREDATFRAICHSVVRLDRMDSTPSPRDELYLAWLEAEWARIEALEGDLARSGRDRLLLRAAADVTLLDDPHPQLRALVADRGHAVLGRLIAAGDQLRRYLSSVERRTIAGVRYYGRSLGAWVSPLWFLDPAVIAAGDRGFALTATCEAALRRAVLGTAAAGTVDAIVDGAFRTIVWRRDLGVVPALAGMRNRPRAS